MRSSVGGSRADLGGAAGVSRNADDDKRHMNDLAAAWEDMVSLLFANAIRKSKMKRLKINLPPRTANGEAEIRKVIIVLFNMNISRRLTLLCPPSVQMWASQGRTTSPGTRPGSGRPLQQTAVASIFSSREKTVWDPEVVSQWLQLRCKLAQEVGNMVESMALDGAVFDEIVGSKDHDALKVCDSDVGE